MSQKIDVNIGGKPVGCIIFDESPAQLFASRTATGFNLSIPATIELKYADSSKPCPMLSNLCVTISVDIASNTELELGVIRNDSVYIGTIPKLSTDISFISCN